MSRLVTRVPPQLSVSVVICAYTERRGDQLLAAVESVRRQRRQAQEVMLVIDHNERLLARARARMAGVTVVANQGARGLSGARNTGVQLSRGDVVAFLDDDATADPDWLEMLLDAIAEPDVIGVGGLARAVWEGGSPAWFPPEFLWVVGGSYEGLPRERKEIRNPIGANMAFRRDAFEAVGGFVDGIGRIGAIPLGCEETEFAIRVRQRMPGSRVLHVPEAAVDHHVSRDRGTWRYFVSRCWAEGSSKAAVARLVGSDAGLSSERSYVARTLPLGVASGVRAGLRGDWGGLGRAAAIVVGLLVTTAAYLVGRLRASAGALDAPGARPG